MLGFPQSKRMPPERRNTKKLELIIKNLETNIELLKEELELDGVENTIKLDEFLQNLDEQLDESDYHYEDDN